jgi:hypothetical protein
MEQQKHFFILPKESWEGGSEGQRLIACLKFIFVFPIYQVSLFETIQRHFSRLDASVVLADVMLIADEVDSQSKPNP